MRKLRDQGKFENSMLAEIEADERVQVSYQLKLYRIVGHIGLGQKAQVHRKTRGQNSKSNSRSE